MEKIKIKVILIQLSGLVFFIYGIYQFKIFSVFEKFNCAFQSLSYQSSIPTCWTKNYGDTEEIFNFISSVMLWKFYGLIIGIVLIGLINWKNKISILNTILGAIFTYIVFYFLFEPFLSIRFNDFGLLFSNNFKTRYLIGGITFTFIGITILFLSVNINLFTNKQKVLN
ncbi:hypothetical protein NU08_4239 [Flavobacterium anhuiense]|uniref:Uncharacterized protein n=1 Tax=Flavobacterium anhuiense TaxID=459526 RepID=A0A444VTA5_9FLAO|nr:hypothetical protein [Flavobacterium anhuiense]RYJ36720.1 hypothetical protein NU08_4239 [Flavobacterium anhuiense]